MNCGNIADIFNMYNFEELLENKKTKNEKLDILFRKIELYRIKAISRKFENNPYNIFKLIKKKFISLFNVKKIDKQKKYIIKKLYEKKKNYRNCDKKILLLINFKLLFINSLMIPHSFLNNQHIIIKKYNKLRFFKYSHYDMINKLKIVDIRSAKHSIGDRGYFLINEGVELNISLINYAFEFLTFFNYSKMWAPCFLNKKLMKKCVQLKDFEEQLYKIKEKFMNKYLIATSEQSICAKIENTKHHISELPKKITCYSECFRKEVGSHGKDTRGIFRVHQFEKIEQFILSQSEQYNSSNNFINLMEITEKFYKLFSLAYQIVLLSSNDINQTSFLKFDIETWFPGSKTFRELVSCSNCKNFQSSGLSFKTVCKKKCFSLINTFNSTLIATERFICNILEEYQISSGFKIPKNLEQFVGGSRTIPYKCFF